MHGWPGSADPSRADPGGGMWLSSLKMAPDSWRPASATPRQHGRCRATARSAWETPAARIVEAGACRTCRQVASGQKA